MNIERGLLLADDSLTGTTWCRAHSDLIDAWLVDLLERAMDSSNPRGIALVAVGGYGRSELCPVSDIDVMLVHQGRSDVAKVADRVWYPIWDQGLHLSHSVFTVKEALALGADDLETATALLSARHIAGDASLSAHLAVGAGGQWEKRSKQWLAQLGDRALDREETFGEVAFRLEPDLKEGRGGLRDVHALMWAEAAHRTILEHDQAGLAAAYGVILDARVELHRITARPGNVLHMQDQEGVAKALGDPDADTLMGRIAEAARLISWTSDDAWRRIRIDLRTSLQKASQRAKPLGQGLILRNGEVELEVKGAASDPKLLLTAACAAAQHKTVIERNSLEQFVAQTRPVAEPWPDDYRKQFVELLLSGIPAIRVIEALDQRGLWSRILPEWEPVRARPQHNAYHTFTVDRHLLETVAQASHLVSRVKRPDLLAICALLHDIGKGYNGDHSSVGADLAEQIAIRMGLPPDDVALVVAAIRHHLLLPEVATRRDLEDPRTLSKVAEEVTSVEMLEILHALTEADSISTGPSAWSPWKAGLVSQLTDGVRQVLQGAAPGDLATRSFPSQEQLERLRQPGRQVDAGNGVVTVITDDRPGIFSRVAGVLALHGLDVLSASAYSTDDGRALSHFKVIDPVRDITPWLRIQADLKMALDGRLALPARVAERVKTYGKSKPMSRNPVVARASFHNDASADATVIDVEAPDGIGILYRVTRALADLDLDIRSAKVQTSGGRAIDAFYVRDRGGGKIIDADVMREVERAIIHAVAE